MFKVIINSENEEDVESAEHDQNEEDLQHQLPATACVLVDLAQFLLRSLDVVQGLFRVVVDPLH